MKTPRVTKAMKAAYRQYMETTVKLEAVTPIVNEIRLNALKEGKFYTDKENLCSGEKVELITDLSKDWLMSDEDFLKYEATCQAEYKKAGIWIDGEKCPKLDLENLQMNQRNELLKISESLYRPAGLTYAVLEMQKVELKLRALDLTCKYIETVL